MRQQSRTAIVSTKNEKWRWVNWKRNVTIVVSKHLGVTLWSVDDHNQVEVWFYNLFALLFTDCNAALKNCIKH